MKKIREKLTGNVIARQLLYRVIVVGMLLTVLFCVIIGGITRHNEHKALSARLVQIQSSHLDIIRGALWVTDTEQLRNSMEGISRLPGIAYAAIVHEGMIISDAGDKTAGDRIDQRYPVVHTFNQVPYVLGELHVMTDASYIRNHIVKRLAGVLLAQAVIMATVSVMLFVVVYQTVVRRLISVSSYTRSLSMDSLDIPLIMENPSGWGLKKSDHPDELDELADTINAMRINLQEAFLRQKEIEAQLEQQQKDLEDTVDRRTASLRRALAEVKELSGLLPICSYCKKIRDDKGYWNQIESYIHHHTRARFSHGICPQCVKEHYPEM